MRKISVCAIVCVLLSIFLLSGCANDQEAKANAEGVVLQHETKQNGTIIQQIIVDTKTGYTYLYTYTPRTLDEILLAGEKYYKDHYNS